MGEGRRIIPKRSGKLRAAWRLTWPVLPIIVIFSAEILQIPLVPEIDFTVDLATHALRTIEVLDSTLDFGPPSQAMGTWCIGGGNITDDELVTRWVYLLGEIGWSLHRALAIFCSVVLAAWAKWDWDLSLPGRRTYSPWLVIGIAFGATTALVFGLNYANSVINGHPLHMGKLTTEGRILLHGEFSMWVKFYGSFILAPVAEEILYRGWLQRLLTSFFRSWPALLLQAIIFGAMHYNYQGFNGFVITSAAGIALGAIYLFSGRLWPCILCHSLFNVVGRGESLLWIWNGRPE